MEIAKAFGTVLYEERKKRKMTHLDISIHSGLEINTISFYERGLSTPTLKSIFKIAIALNVDPEYLVARTRKLMKE